jgi:hypothetical protein
VKAQAIWHKILSHLFHYFPESLLYFYFSFFFSNGTLIILSGGKGWARKRMKPIKESQKEDDQEGNLKLLSENSDSSSLAETAPPEDEKVLKSQMIMCFTC